MSSDYVDDLIAQIKRRNDTWTEIRLYWCKDGSDLLVATYRSVGEADRVDADAEHHAKSLGGMTSYRLVAIQRELRESPFLAFGRSVPDRQIDRIVAQRRFVVAPKSSSADHQSMLETTIEAIVEMKKTLSWYADEQNHRRATRESEEYESAVNVDRGERARTVLAWISRVL